MAGFYVSTDEHKIQVNSFEGQVWLAHVPISRKKEMLANKLQVGSKLTVQCAANMAVLTAFCEPHHCRCSYAYV